MLMKRHRPSWLLPMLFLIVAGPLGIFLAEETPPGQVPDEHVHIIKADSLLQGEFTGHREILETVDGARHSQQGVDGDVALQSLSSEPSPAQLTQQHWDDVHRIPWSTVSFLPLGPIAGYWPIFYLPAAAALALAKATGEIPFDAFISARLANLAVFLVAGVSALRLAYRGQALLFATLCLPMTLHLAASVNQDGLMIGACVLAAALLTRPPPSAAASPSRWKPAWLPDAPARLWAGVLLLNVVMAKPPYLPLAGLLLVPLPSWRDWKLLSTRFGMMALLAMAALGWTWVTVHYVSTSVIRPPAEAGPLWPGPTPTVFAGTDMAAQMRVLLAKPHRFLSLPWRSLVHDEYIGYQMIGILSYLDLWLPFWLYHLWTWALLSAVIADILWSRAGAAVMPIMQTLWLLLCIVLAWLAIYISQYFAWTPIGEAYIWGPQGRYFLPLIPVLAVALPSWGRSRSAGAALLALPVAASIANLAVLPGLIVRHFYMH